MLFKSLSLKIIFKNCITCNLVWTRKLWDIGLSDQTAQMGLRNSSKSVGDSIFSYRQLEGAPPRPRFEILSYHPSAWVSKRSRCQNFCTWLCPKFSPLFLSYSNFFVCTNICYSLPLTYYYLFHITYNCSVIKYRLFWPSVPYSPLWENGKWFKSYHMTHMIQI